MRALAVAVAASVGLAACGSDDGGGDSLNPAFNGTWTGITTVALSGLSPFAYSSGLIIAVSGQNATVGYICPDGSGSVTAHGSGNAISWSGRYTCPAVSLLGCPAVTATYTSAAGTLNGSGTLTVVAQAVTTGCSTTRPGTLTFSGTK